MGDDQTNPDVALFGDGSFVVVWQSDNQDGEGFGILGRRFGPGGVSITGEFQVNDTTASNQTRPAVAADPETGFVVAWQSSLQDTSGEGVFLRTFRPNGTPIDSADVPVNGTVAGDQENASVALSADGEVAVVWQDFDHANGTSREDVVGRVFVTDVFFEALFSDGFESGDVSAWSTSVP